MKWEGRRESDNVEYKGRSESSGRGGLPIGGFGKMGGGGILLLLVVSLLLGQNPLDMLTGGGATTGPSHQYSQQYEPRSEEEEQLGKFLSVLLADTEDVWTKIFEEHGATYKKPKLTIFQDRVNSGCGVADSRMGPFYCGQDQTVYIDLKFAKELKTTFNAPGDFPLAYVLAHEVGHHVQLQTGKLREVQSLRNRVSDVEFNNEMVKLELQADYYAGVLAHHLERKGYLDHGDVEEGMRAASGVGDDRIQEMSGQKADPDTFQHGSSAQRRRWFLRGYKYGDLEHGNTFDTENAEDL